MPNVRVLYDAVNWQVRQEDGAVRHYRAAYGEVVDLPQEEVDRLSSLTPPAVVPEDEVRGAVLDEIGRGGRGGATSVSDEQIKEFSPPEAVAFVAQYPDEARRVYDIERSGRGDQAVLRATGFEMTEDADDGSPSVYPSPGVSRLADPRDGLRPEVREAVSKETEGGSKRGGARARRAEGGQGGDRTPGAEGRGETEK